MARRKNVSNDYRQLEHRQLMAGDVSASLVSGDLIIEGDSQSNRVIVREWQNQIAVLGSDQTTINGSNLPAVFTVTDDIRINMNGGNDFLFVRDLELDGRSHSDLIIRGGSGQDKIEIENVEVRRNVNIRGDSHSDEILVNKVFADNISVRGDSGSDNLAVFNSFASEDLLVRGGSGNDGTYVVDTHVGETFRWYGDFGRNATLFINVNAENIYIYGGTGNDEVNLAFGNRARDLLFANMGSGDDTLWMGDSVAGQHYLHGGDGNDKIHGAGWFGFDPWSNNHSFERWW